MAKTAWTKGGKVVVDSRGRVILCDRCPCFLGRVLLWATNCIEGVGLRNCQLAYLSLGIEADLWPAWTGNLHDYTVIIHLTAESLPPWMDRVTTGKWTGRFHLSGEWNAFPATNTYVNNLTFYSGLTLVPRGGDTIGCDAGHAIRTKHPLCAGTKELVYAATSTIVGGSTVFINELHNEPMMQQRLQVKAIGKVDWVVCGDSNHIIDDCPLTATKNKQFLWNLVTVPIP